ncbi:FGGY-family carbohydrate kinase [Rhodococcoides kyotonense]|uniref:FGGY family of carbohydrate kinases, C-terminal domain n=1 Tax=Rhodococcoides kyotonense TaxID=398843 RepID=A0A239H086_9NOCA|nr:FGGY-family carbohydrate kinase [Rhodococcus kyotonensis]SNS74839.1 FGGY family of carbohydrate kinases, C-terminal domain [Rhodococcus kyotonensis]
MATIGLSVESGAMYAVLFDQGTDAVVANRMTALDGGVATALPAAVDGMRAAARRRKLDVDAVGLVYSSDSERDELKSIVDYGSIADVSLFPASSAFLGWLARSSEFADAERVLLYYMGDAGVSISLADAATSTVSTAKTAALDSMSPEKIGSTVPLAWEVLDEAGVKANSVALFGDRSGNRDLVDILALGLGLPVVRVADADQVAALGAAVLAVDKVPAKTAKVVEALPPVVSVEPVTIVPTSTDPVPPVEARGAQPRKKLILTAALLAAVLSGGVALASTLPDDGATTAAPTETSAPAVTEVDTSLAGATSSVVIAAPPETQLPPAPAPAVEQPVFVEPEVPVTWESVQAPAPVVRQGTVETLSPIPAQAIPPNAAVVPTTVDAPQFTIPPVIPEAGKSQEQLEQEAWDRHWQHTAQWLEQEIAGN